MHAYIELVERGGLGCCCPQCRQGHEVRLQRVIHMKCEVAERAKTQPHAYKDTPIVFYQQTQTNLVEQELAVFIHMLQCLSELQKRTSVHLGKVQRFSRSPDCLCVCVCAYRNALTKPGNSTRVRFECENGQR